MVSDVLFYIETYITFCSDKKDCLGQFNIAKTGE